MLGPHCKKQDNQRQVALNNGWECFQTHYYTPRSLNTPYLSPLVKEANDYPLWIWHAAYVASANPGYRYKVGTRKYLQSMIEHAEQLKINSIILHLGATKRKTEKEVVDECEEFLYNLDRDIDKITIELGANLSAINCNPLLLIKRFPWCLDIAHAHAAGIAWIDLWRLIEQYPPSVCHINYPGSDFGSGRDVHGWRSASYNNLSMNVKYDHTVKMLNRLNIPLILEGSGFASSNMTIELRVLKDVLA